MVVSLFLVHIGCLRCVLNIQVHGGFLIDDCQYLAHSSNDAHVTLKIWYHEFKVEAD